MFAGAVLVVIFFSFSFDTLHSSAYFTQFLFNTDTLSTALTPLETHTQTFTVITDPSFPPLGSGIDAPYQITRSPHCLVFNTNGTCHTFAPDLCPYLALTPIDGESADTGFPHDPAQIFTTADGILEPESDPIDHWNLDTTAPCFTGECPADYDATRYGTPLPQSLKGETFSCDLSVFSSDTSVILSRIPLASVAYADTLSNTLTVSAVLAGSPVAEGCTVNCYSNVLFLPGIESSRLYETNVLGDENQLWEPNRNADIAKLYLDGDGTTVRQGIYAKEDGVMDEINGTGANVYKSFIIAMDKLKAAGTINDWKPIAYDWRLSLEDILSNGKRDDGGHIFYSGAQSGTTTPYIIQELRRLVATSRTGKVTIIAHSNGGLLAKTLLNKLKETHDPLYDKIDKIIFVAVPQVGTPAALAASLHGYDQDHLFGLITSKSVARTFASTSPMLYHLLPSASYFTYVDDPVATFDPLTIPDWSSRYGTDIHSEERLHNFVTDSFGKVDAENGDIDHPIQLHDTLFAQAEALHATLDRWTPPAGADFIQIAGWGVPKTVSGIHYQSAMKQACLNGICGALQSVFEPEIDFTIDGDGTVVVPSALWTSTTTGVRNYWVNLRNYNNVHWIVNAGGLLPFNHASILEVNELRDFLTDIIASSTKPLADYTYLSTEAPPSTDHRLRYTLHSPLSLNLYDAEGRHTGISTTTGEIEAQIPGTYYDEFADVKYIFTDASSSARIVMDGYATGIFTFSVEELEGDTLLASTTWKDMPTTPETRVALDVGSDIHTLSPMNIDINGDGTPDFSLAPVIGGTATLPPPDLTPPVTTASTAGTLGTNDWYTSNILVTLTATDTGSGVASTTYSLNNGTTWIEHTNPFSITTEGISTILYHSTDKAGNIEATSTLVIKIDKTAPEAAISVSTSTQDILVEGTDNLGTTTVNKISTTTYTLTDVAGHTTTLFFSKTYNGKYLTYAKLTGMQYDTAPKMAIATSSLVYLWDTKTTPPTLLSQTIAANNTFLITALYDKTKNKTTIVVLKKNTPYQTFTFAGLKVVRLVTSKGVVGYGW